jgi:hypothetical protein
MGSLLAAYPGAGGHTRARFPQPVAGNGSGCTKLRGYILALARSTFASLAFERAIVKEGSNSYGALDSVVGEMNREEAAQEEDKRFYTRATIRCISGNTDSLGM